MTAGVNYSNYQKSFSRVSGSNAAIMLLSGLEGENNIFIRKVLADELKPKTNRAKARDIGDLIRAINKYIFLVCACGLKIKIPSNFKESKVACPR